MAVEATLVVLGLLLIFRSMKMAEKYKRMCEVCDRVWKTCKRDARFCSPHCRYIGLLEEGIYPCHSAPHTEEAKKRICKARAKQGSNVWNKGIKTGLKPWNLGLTSETDERVRIAGLKISISRKGKKQAPMSLSARRKIGDSRRGEDNYAKRPEVREKIRQTVLRLYAEKPEIKRKISESVLRSYREHPEILENRQMCGRNQHSGGFSSLEMRVATAFDKIGMLYLHNSRVGRYWPDFVIFGRVVIECDGDYWHKDAKKEQRRDNYLMDRGYFVFHLREKDIIADALECVLKVIRLYEPFVELAV
jgi:very-short-patch-repair endonuclease